MGCSDRPASTSAEGAHECLIIMFFWCWGRFTGELGPEDVSLLERCPHFIGCCVQALGPEDVFLFREVSSFQRMLCTRHSVS